MDNTDSLSKIILLGVWGKKQDQFWSLKGYSSFKVNFVFIQTIQKRIKKNCILMIKSKLNIYFKMEIIVNKGSKAAHTAY